MKPLLRLGASLDLGLILLLAVLSALSVVVGRVWIPLGHLADAADPRWLIITELRIPRTVLGLLVGADPALSGANLQGYPPNPLADPGVLGVSAMAALGAVLTLFLNLAIASPWVLPA